MRSITVAKVFFYVVALTSILTIFFGIPYILWVTITTILMLGLFINLIDVLHQVLVQGNTFNGSLTFLRETIPYQMEKLDVITHTDAYCKSHKRNCPEANAITCHYETCKR